MSNIERKLEAWKKHLIDLGKRNPLINMKTQAKSSLRFTSPSMMELWDHIVIQEKTIEFGTILDDYEDEIEQTDGSTYPYGEVETNHVPKDVQRILRSLRKKAKTFADEQGINVLYMTFGIIEWKDTPTSENVNRSPLVLVPVSLTWESINSPICLSMIDDEILLNPAIRHKFSEEFNTEIPELVPDESLSSYFRKLRQYSNAEGFSINDEVYISILSFTKIGIYNDIEKHKEQMAAHPLIQALSGEGDGLRIQESLSVELGEIDHDSEDPAKVFQIVDADSSQQDAITYAKKGISFVLQGPPGTGKSQTITNIIAEQIASGKKVLFVSEKKAALDVVYRRLKDAGLADFCFILHDTKANKKAVVEQLRTVMEMSSKHAEISDAAMFELDELVRCRDTLNGYANELNKKIEPLRKSVFQANGEISALDDIEDVVFAFPNVTFVSDSEYRNILSLLNRLKEALSRMKTRIADNPWRNSIVSYATQEFRHDLNAIGSRIENQCQEAIRLSASISEETGVARLLSLDDLFGMSLLLRTAGDFHHVPAKWFEDNNILLVESTVSGCREFRNRFEHCCAELRSMFEDVKKVFHSTSSETLVKLDNRQYVAKVLDSIESFISHDPFYFAADRDPARLGFVKGVVEKTLTFNSEKAKLLVSYSEDLFSIDSEEMLYRFEVNSNKLLKFLNSSYRDDKRQFMSMRKNRDRKYSDREAIVILKHVGKLKAMRSELVDKSEEMMVLFPTGYSVDSTDMKVVSEKITNLSTLQEFRRSLNSLNEILSQESEEHEKLVGFFGSLYQGFSTDWDAIDHAIEWAHDVSKMIGQHDFKDNSFIRGVCESESFARRCAAFADKLDELKKSIEVDLKWFTDLFKADEAIDRLEISRVAARVYDCRNNLSLLDQWNDLRNTLDACEHAHLGDYLKQVMGGYVAREHIVEAFKKRFFRLWIDGVIPNLPEVRDFNEAKQDGYIREFRRLDKEQFAIAQKAVKVRLINNLPDINAFSNGQVNILKRELAKQRRLLPVRKLFGMIPNLIMTLKPCLMMSPLSVSQYLEADNYKFDTVIFDEASQVKTENALGAIFRAKQVIIAGDSKQLPPTSFFDSASVVDFDSDEEDENDSGILDTSLLEESLYLPSRELLWHYRSKHEHLIAFSNAKIYRNRLVSFPSNRERSSGWGVEYIYVENGIYNGKGNPKGNLEEAKRVADEVFKHFKEHPDRTLGVVTFGTIQEEAIENQINIRRQRETQYEEFFREDLNEPFFVKSLENVQGDERDTIIFSIGYAKDKAGIMRMNFGPLSRAGGERRLNVAITRAKYNVKLVGSILPTDILIERISEDGPKLLRKYIEYAINGPEVLEQESAPAEDEEFESPFEKSVFDFLSAKGYKVETQVGCSGYRIDLAVKHPKLSGIYVLGIECDGAMYHSSKTARERDRLRQSLLESMGWKLYRIWSTDWIKDMVNEKRRLLDAVQKAIDGYVEDSRPISNQSEKKSANQEKYISMSNRESTADLFREYEKGVIDAFSDITFVPPGKKEMGIINVIRKEGPVHREVIYRRFSEAKKRGQPDRLVRLSPVDKRDINNVLYRLRSQYVQSGEFFSFPDQQVMSHPRVAGDRAISEIAPMELELAIITVLKSSCGVSREDLIRTTAQVFGYERFGTNIREIFEKTYDDLKASGKLREVDGVVLE
ncbi:MAG: DUF4011 domain-containing protein [Spirochaetales bacterium]|nr:DUF4011 domain-containing protein [Spirochaetales bacterium]